MPASKHMVVVEKRRGTQRMTLTFGPVHDRKADARCRAVENRPGHARTRREQVSASNDS